MSATKQRARRAAQMGAHRIDALPFLDKHQPVSSPAIDMAVVRRITLPAARSRAMLGAERYHVLAMPGVRMMWPVMRIILLYLGVHFFDMLRSDLE